MKEKLSRLVLPLLVLSTLPASAITRYVDLSNPSPMPPYMNWSTAATSIQEAIETADPGDEIIVTNGVYQTGGRVVGGTALANRAAVIKPMTIRSVNGPLQTTIQGHQVPAVTNGTSAVRCVYLTNDTVLAGFTITGGATLAAGDASQTDGGGIWCESRSALVTNCVIISNSANSRGGGVFRGTLRDCTILSNTVPQSSWWGDGGGVYDSSLNRCLLRGNFAWYGAGANNSALDDCLLTGNWAWDVGGGADHSTLNRCTLVGNLSNGGGGTFGGVLNQCLIAGNIANWGGGTVSGTLSNCTITGNSAGTIGGAYCGLLNNCIVYGNSADTETNYLFDGEFVGLMTSSCTTPLPAGGTGNITQAPLFVDEAGGNYRLQPNSPCINAGNNAYVSSNADLDGRPRIVKAVTDIGAFEFQGPGMGEFIGWLENSALPTDGSADFTDPDADGANNWHEWRADTIPTNTISVLRMVTVTNSPTGANVTWQSVATRSYFLERATDLGATAPFLIVSNSIPGGLGTSTVTDPTATNAGPYFYRVGVQ